MVGSTKALLEVRFSGGSRSALKALAANEPAMDRWQASQDLEHPIYWARESLYFKSAACQIATPDFRAVRCLNQAEREGLICLQLEWVEGRPGAEWRELDYEQAAYALGTWQRRLKKLPDEPWVSRDWLAGYLALRMDLERRLAYPGLWSDAGIFSSKEQSLVINILEQKKRLFGQLRRLPQLPAHNDFWPPNLFMVNAQVVAVDWAFVGTSAPASDLCTLMFDSIYDGFLTPSDPHALAARLLRAYAEGAKIADDARLEFALYTGLVVKYLWFFAHVQLEHLSKIECSEAHLAALDLVLAAGSRLEKLGSA